MARISNSEKEKKTKLAKQLFLNSYDIKEIAETIGMRKSTLEQWCRDGDWDKLKAARTISRDELVNKTLMNINKLQEALLEMNPLEDNYYKNCQVLVQLAGVIEKLSSKTISIITYIEVCNDIERWLEQRQYIDDEVTEEIRILINKWHELYIAEKVKSQK